jgi:hypothetical protein
MQPTFNYVMQLVIKLPKMHIEGHQRAGHCMYNLNFTVDTGRFCGECIEWMWATLNPLALEHMRDDTWAPRQHSQNAAPCPQLAEAYPHA